MPQSTPSLRRFIRAKRDDLRLANAVGKAFTSIRPGLSRYWIHPVDVCLHLLATSFVDNFPTHDASRIGQAIPRGSQVALHTVDTFPQDNLYPAGTFVQHDHVNSLTVFHAYLDLFRAHRRSLRLNGSRYRFRGMQTNASTSGTEARSAKLSARIGCWASYFVLCTPLLREIFAPWGPVEFLPAVRHASEIIIDNIYMDEVDSTSVGFGYEGKDQSRIDV